MPTSPSPSDAHEHEHAHQTGGGRSGGDDAAAVPEHTDAQHLLDRYLRDHHAGAVAGVALVRRCHHNNLGSEFEPALRQLVDEIETDAESLSTIMETLSVEPSRIKVVAAHAGELAARLKFNGRLVEYSPSSRVLELEGLRAGIAGKRQLWESLNAAELDALGPTDLETLRDRADRQLAVAAELHRRAARLAFAA